MEKKKEKQKPLTLDQLTDYAKEVLLPAIDLGVSKRIENLRRELLSKDDEIITRLDKIDTENTMRNAQEGREKEFHKVVIGHMKNHSTSQEDLAKISKLDIV